MKSVGIEIEIERMYVYGVGSASESLIVAAMERELAILIAERGLPSAMLGMDVVEIDGEVIRVSEGLHAAATGEAIARRMYEGWCTREGREKEDE